MEYLVGVSMLFLSGLIVYLFLEAKESKRVYNDIMRDIEEYK